MRTIRNVFFLLMAVALFACTSSNKDESTGDSTVYALKVHKDTILHVIILKPGKGQGHAFVYTLPTSIVDSLSDTSTFIIRQLKCANQQGTHGLAYPSAIYPKDTFFTNGQGLICEIWVATTQTQWNAGIPQWIVHRCDTGYSHNTLDTINTRGFKVIYPNL